MTAETRTDASAAFVDTKSPSISVITLLWRNESYASGFFQTLEHATRRSARHIELVAVVNGPEGQAAAARLLAISERSSWVSVRFVTLATNEGFAGGVNVGCACATAPTLVVANLDLEFDEAFVLALTQHPELSARPCFLAPRVRTTWSGAISISSAGPLRRDAFHRLRELDGPIAPGDAVPGANGSCLVFGRPLLDQRLAAIGGLFDPEYHSYYEDVDLFWWAERCGIPTYFAPDLVVTHHQGGSFGGRFRYRDRSSDLRSSVLANYRLNVLKHGRGAGAFAGWLVGEVGYVALNLRSEGYRGLGTYLRSWKQSVERVRAIRARRGGVR